MVALGMPRLLIFMCLLAGVEWVVALEAVHNTSEWARQTAAQRLPHPLRDADMRRSKDLVVSREGPNIVFWRLQKVGSSTLLSILLSFGYRTNHVPRRKATSNSFCRVIASAALSTSIFAKDSNLSSSNTWDQMTKYVPRWMFQDSQLIESDLMGRAVMAPTAQEQEWLRRYATQRVPGSWERPGKRLSGQMPLGAEHPLPAREEEAMMTPYKIVLSHEICNLNASIIERYLRYAFPVSRVMGSDGEVTGSVSDVREVFMVRDPLPRAISVYYFWGEIFRMVQSRKGQLSQRKVHIPESNLRRNARMLRYDNPDDNLVTASFDFLDDWLSAGTSRALATVKRSTKLGSHGKEGEVSGTFRYHGNENTAPDESIAMGFASSNFPFHAGMPGPSFSWSAFANDLDDAVARISTDRLFTVVLERLDESLVALRHYLGWSLADVVVTKHRKALSSHPKAADWPQAATDLLKTRLNAQGEYKMYDAANLKLDERIAKLNASGIDVQGEIQVLNDLRHRVTELCLMNETNLEVYRDAMLATGLRKHDHPDKLRDVEDKFVENGDMFSFNLEMLGSFDVCGNCEAHALLFGIEQGLARTVHHSTPLFTLDYQKFRKNNHRFHNCPQ